MPRANTKIHCARSGGRNFEILHALKCVLGTSEAPFSCIHTVNTYPKVAVFIWRFQNTA